MKKLLHLVGLCLLVILAINLISFYNDVNKDITAVQTAADIGKKLFSDVILSRNKTVSCASCHNPNLAFSDTVAFSLGVDHHLTGRNTPTAMYLQKSTIFFWDGRAKSYEQQASGPITNKREMDLSISDAVKRLKKNEFYKGAFLKIYGKVPDSILLLNAIASFERTLAYHDSPYDRFLKGNDTAMSPSAIRGFRLFFREKACGNSPCHKGDDFNSDSLVNIGVHTKEDQGLYSLSGNADDIGRFKSPTLRNIAVTYPYMHNGKHKTLREVIDYYNDPKNFPVAGTTHPDVKDPRGKMNEQQINDMIAFLRALTDYRYMRNIK